MKEPDQRLGEYIFIVRMDEMGKKVTKSTDFVDSNADVDVIGSIGEEWLSGARSGAVARSHGSSFRAPTQAQKPSFHES